MDGPVMFRREQMDARDARAAAGRAHERIRELEAVNAELLEHIHGNEHWEPMAGCGRCARLLGAPGADVG